MMPSMMMLMMMIVVAAGAGADRVNHMYDGMVKKKSAVF
jgi:hypothetical protein